MGDELEPAMSTALVEVTPGAALVFGDVPAGLDLVPFSLVSTRDREAVVNAVASSSSVLNVGGQLANALAQAHGLVRLAPETIHAMQAGATAVKSGGYYIGTLSHAGKFSNSVRWLPAGGATAAGLVASLGPAFAMIAIQIQLSEITGLVKQNLALTETVLKSVRNEQWAELTGLEQAMSRAVEEANEVGQVTVGVWQNISGREADLLKQRDLFRRNIETHGSELAKNKGHKERRQYIEKNGEAIILDLHSLLLAHKAWFEYQALRAGHLRLTADADANEAKLLESVVENARNEYDEVVAQIASILDTLTRELWILAELPGKHTLPFTGARRSAKDVVRMAEQLLDAVQRLSPETVQRPAELVRPELLIAEDTSQVDQDLRILRWHLGADEQLEALAVARETPEGALEGVGDAVRGVAAAIWRGPKAVGHAVTEPGVPVLIAVTEGRVLVSELEQFRQQGIVDRSIPNRDIAFVRGAPVAGDRTELDVITADDAKTSWRFARGSVSAAPVDELRDLLKARVRPIAPTIRDADRAAQLTAAAGES